MLLRKLVSWLVALLGILLGMLVIAVVGGTDVGVHAPFAVFVVVVAGCTPVLASLLALHNPRIAARIDLCVSPITPLLVLLFSGEFSGIFGSVVVFSGALVVPGFFWLLTSRHNWPHLLGPPHSLRGASFNTALGAGLFCLIIVVASFSSLFLPWWPPVGDCSGRPIFTEQGVPANIDFTARIVFVGPRSFHGSSLWSIARVEQRFGSSPAWPLNLILLRGFFRPDDQSGYYLVEGSRSGAAITHFLPVIEPIGCGHTARLEDATIALRCLRDGLPRSGGRLIGKVHRGVRESEKPAAGVKVRISGPAGSSITVTDAQGIYDATGLPAGYYTIELGAPEWRVVNTYYLSDREIREDSLWD